MRGQGRASISSTFAGFHPSKEVFEVLRPVLAPKAGTGFHPSKEVFEGPRRLGVGVEGGCFHPSKEVFEGWKVRIS